MDREKGVTFLVSLCGLRVVSLNMRCTKGSGIMGGVCIVSDAPPVPGNRNVDGKPGII